MQKRIMTAAAAVTAATSGQSSIHHQSHVNSMMIPLKTPPEPLNFEFHPDVGPCMVHRTPVRLNQLRSVGYSKSSWCTSINYTWTSGEF